MRKVVLSVLILFLLITMGLFFYPSINPKVAILYIATGNYSVYWPEFYKSMEKNFLPNYEKQYFVFTDKKIKKEKNVTHIYRKWHGFPGDSIDRFDLFLSLEKELKKYKYTYFLNANAEVVQPVGEEILPTRKQKITVAIHPGFYRKGNVYNYPYERRAFSTAYIPEGLGKHYVQGGFNGGYTTEYLKMVKTLSQNIKEDRENNVQAIWHDESHLNRYVIDKEPLYLPPNYIWANFDNDLYQEYLKENAIKIIMRDKAYFPRGGMKGIRSIPKLSREEEIQQDKYYIDKGTKYDYLSYVKEEDRYCAEVTKECAQIEKKDGLLIVLWEDSPAESFSYDEKTEVFVPVTPYSEFTKESFFVNQGDWRDTLVYNKETNKYCRTTSSDCGFVRTDNTKLKMIWDSWPEENFIYDKNTDSYIKKKKD